jgi:hypothetical protein
LLFASVASITAAGLPALASGAQITTLAAKLAPSTQGIHPDIDLNDSGRALAGWRTGGTSPVLRVAVRSSTGVWGAPITLGKNAYAPRVAVGPRGDLAVIWSSAQGLRLSSRPAGTTRWQHRALSSSPKDYALTVVVDANGRATAIVARDVGTQYAPQITARVFQGGVRSTTAIWRHTATPLAMKLSSEVVYGLDVSPSGVAGLIWRNSAGATRLSRTRGSAPWEQPITVATSPTAVADVTFNRAGDAAAVWAVRTGDTWTGTTAMIRRASASAWPATRIAMPDGAYPMAALSEARRLLLVGGAKDPVLGQVVRVASQSTDGTWGLTSTRLGGCACEPTLWRATFDSAGNAFVAGVIETSATNTLATKGFVSAIPKGTATAIAPVVYPVLGSAVFPSQIEAEGTGKAVVIWGRINFALAPVRAWSLKLTP